MTQPTHSQTDVDSRVGIARLEEGMKHLEKTVADGFKRLEHTLSAGNEKHDELAARVDVVEQRVDKIYWVWSAAVFVGTPLMMAVSKFVFAKFGL